MTIALRESRMFDIRLESTGELMHATPSNPVKDVQIVPEHQVMVLKPQIGLRRAGATLHTELAVLQSNIANPSDAFLLQMARRRATKSGRKSKGISGHGFMDAFASVFSVLAFPITSVGRIIGQKLERASECVD